MRQVVCVSALLGALQLVLIPNARSQAPADPGDSLPGPVVTVGHGALLDAQGQEVLATPELILETQRAYIEALAGQASEEQRTTFGVKQQRVLEGQDWSPSDRIHANAALIAWLIGEVGPAQASQMQAINAALLRRVAGGSVERAAQPDAAGAAPSEAMQRNLDREALVTALARTQAGGEQYTEECRNAGVPIPPDWGTSAWRSRGILANEFISGPLEAEVFVFESTSPRGICMALPRSQGNDIPLLGIICQGSDTSKVCFWDNDHRPGSRTIRKGDTVPFRDFLGGADLNIPDQLAIGGICSDCHAGRNPFVIHPGSPLEVGPIQSPSTWVTPLVHPSWPQNPGPTTVLDGLALDPGESSCLGCHNPSVAGELPELSTALRGYCSAVVENAIRQTMPPGSPGSADNRKQDQAIQAACRQPPKPSQPPAPTVSAELLQLIHLPLRSKPAVAAEIVQLLQMPLRAKPSTAAEIIPVLQIPLR